MNPTETALTDDKDNSLNRALELLGFDDRTKAAANAALSVFEENGQLEAHLGQMIRHNAVDAAQAIDQTLDQIREHPDTDEDGERLRLHETAAGHCIDWLARDAVLHITSEARKRRTEEHESPRARQVGNEMRQIVDAAEKFLAVVEARDQEALKPLEHSFLGFGGLLDRLDTAQEVVSTLKRDFQVVLAAGRDVFYLDPDTGKMKSRSEKPGLAPKGGTIKAAAVERLGAEDYLVFACLCLAEWSPAEKAERGEAFADLIAQVWAFAFEEEREAFERRIDKARSGRRGPRIDPQYATAAVDFSDIIPNDDAFWPTKRT